MTRQFTNLFATMAFGLSLLLSSVGTLADGGVRVITDVLEEVRITVSETAEAQTSVSDSRRAASSNTTPALGNVISEHLDCNPNCATHTHQYDQATRLINPFGAEVPIKELTSWSGSRAEIHYRVASNRIELIRILP